MNSVNKSKVAEWCYGLIAKKLIEPYWLSFTTITEIRSIWVYIVDSEGNQGMAETVPLVGYGHETEENVVAFFRQVCLEGKRFEDIKVNLRANHSKRPFAVSAISTALDWSRYIDPLIANYKPLNLTYPVSASGTIDQINAKISKGRALGYYHFKVKVGDNFGDELANVLAMLDNYKDTECIFRFDANQGFSLTEAKTFAHSLRSYKEKNLLWLEQPLEEKNWAEMKKLCESVDFPFMLDESIYTIEDIEKAADIGCSAVKLKLFKHLGISDCLSLAECAYRNGLKTTIGNGVSSDLGNLIELLIASAISEYLVDGSECNGFDKLTESVLQPQFLKVVSGKAILDNYPNSNKINNLGALKNNSDWWEPGR